MAAVIASSIVDIYESIRLQLIARIPGLTDSMIKITAHPNELPHFDGEHDLVIRVGSFISVLALWSATTAHKVRRFMIFYPRTRMALDPHDRDTQWLLKTTGVLNTSGHLRWEETCLSAIWGFFANDAQDSTVGNLLTYQEIQLSQGTDPVRGVIDQIWGTSAITCEVEYLLSLGAPPVIG